MNPIRYNDPTGLNEEEGIFDKITRKFEEVKSFISNAVGDAVGDAWADRVRRKQEEQGRRAGDDPQTIEQSATEHAQAQSERPREAAKQLTTDTIDVTVTVLVTRGVGGLGSGLKFGGHKKDAKWLSQMEKRGWTEKQISKAVDRGKRFPAENLVNKGNAATRYVHPETGRSVVVDNVTKEIIHIGGDGFKY